MDFEWKDFNIIYNISIIQIRIVTLYLISAPNYNYLFAPRRRYCS
jgi:hypothetical protein